MSINKKKSSIRNVKFGKNVTIIEQNAVVGAGSVVTKNCEKNQIYFGNPAEKIKK